MGRGPRRPSRAQSCFPAKENPWGVGFGHRRPPAQQQGLGSQGQPCTAWPSGERRAGTKTAYVAFLSRGALGLLLAAGGDFPFAKCSCQKLVLGRRFHEAAAQSGRAGSGGMAAAWAQKALARPILLPRQGEHVGSGFPEPETPSKAAVPRVSGQPAPLCPLESGRPGAKTDCVAFLS